jgi:hypothetical protein
LRHFEDVADELIPPSSNAIRNLDIYDYLQAQRLEVLQRAADPSDVPTRADTPLSLVRRYEVCIIPHSSSRPKKLREIKSAGKVLSQC